MAETKRPIRLGLIVTVIEDRTDHYTDSRLPAENFCCRLLIDYSSHRQTEACVC